MLRIKVDNLSVLKQRPEIIKYSYPLLFIHGAGGTSKYLNNYLLYFARAGWRSYAINLRGHYPSDRESTLAQVTFEDYVEDVEKVIKVLKLENCALIGHSMGGLIAQKTAMHINTVKALVTISSAPPLGVSLEINNSLPFSGTLMKSMWGLMNLRPVKPTYFMAEKTVLNNIAEKERENIYSMFVAESLLVAYQVSQGVYIDPAKITCPKLVIGGDRDAIAAVSMEKKIAEFLHADFIAYKQFAHLPMLERGWEKSAGDISDWLIKNVRIERRKVKRKE